MAFLEGKILLDKYIIKRPIGGGTFADVYFATDKDLGTKYAIKVLRENFAKQKVFLERFRREAKTLKTLDHPNIVHLYDYYVDEEANFGMMVMEYVPGNDLREYLKEQLSVGVILNILKQLCSAIGYAHEKNYIHMDIKPENIVIGENGDLKVLDFGIARLQDADINTLVGAGAPAYMAPEEIKRRAKIQSIELEPRPENDIYSIGVLLFEMFTGRRPFIGEFSLERESIDKIIDEQLNYPPPKPTDFNPSIPKNIEKIILKCLEKKQSDRYNSVKNLINDFNQALYLQGWTDLELEEVANEWATKIQDEIRTDERNKEKSDKVVALFGRPVQKTTLAWGVLFITGFVIFGVIVVLLLTQILSALNDNKIGTSQNSGIATQVAQQSTSIVVQVVVTATESLSEIPIVSSPTLRPTNPLPTNTPKPRPTSTQSIQVKACPKGVKGPYAEGPSTEGITFINNTNEVVELWIMWNGQQDRKYICETPPGEYVQYVEKHYYDIGIVCDPEGERKWGGYAAFNVLLKEDKVNKVTIPADTCK